MRGDVIHNSWIVSRYGGIAWMVMDQWLFLSFVLATVRVVGDTHPDLKVCSRLQLQIPSCEGGENVPKPELLLCGVRQQAVFSARPDMRQFQNLLPAWWQRHFGHDCPQIIW